MQFLVKTMVVKVPPPTRGWSADENLDGHADRGSPAHAGMVPGPAVPLYDYQRFPRPRGDGPVARGRARRAQAVPPPTRGWSLHPPTALQSVCGSPAHAGMVPQKAMARRGNRGFPRPRGDGPCFVCRGSGMVSVPPPTRGWSSIPRR